MVWPPFAMVTVPVADLRASPGGDAELVDQVHYHEWPRVLGSRDGWHYVQAEDHYFGWIAADALRITPEHPQWRVVAVALASVHRGADAASETIGWLPAGAPLSQTYPEPVGPWALAGLAVGSGYVSFDDTVVIADLPHHHPMSDDLLATAEAFLGVPYLWGGTTALGMDCSGFVQQVYRLNGIRLDRDADQQATEGRPVVSPRAGDLIFFSSREDPIDPRITHVALATGDRTFLHAPQRGGAVERGVISAERPPRAIRRYLAEPE